LLVVKDAVKLLLIQNFSIKRSTKIKENGEIMKSRKHGSVWNQNYALAYSMVNKIITSEISTQYQMIHNIIKSYKKGEIDDQLIELIGKVVSEKLNEVNDEIKKSQPYISLLDQMKSLKNIRDKLLVGIKDDELEDRILFRNK